MNTIEDFENAPVGATASSAETNARYVKSSDGWLLFDGQGAWRVDEYDLESEGFTLDPEPTPAPENSREALELVWDLAHPVKEGQVIPVGTWLIERRDNEIIVGKNSYFNITASEWDAENLRTLDPLPEPDWLDAPAVLASTDWCPDRQVWLPSTPGHWKCTCCDANPHWSTLVDVIPLYPKEDA